MATYVQRNSIFAIKKFKSPSFILCLCFANVFFCSTIHIHREPIKMFLKNLYTHLEDQQVSPHTLSLFWLQSYSIVICSCWRPFHCDQKKYDNTKIRVGLCIQERSQPLSVSEMFKMESKELCYCMSFKVRRHDELRKCV